MRIYAQDDSPLQSQEENPQSSPATEPDSSVPSVESTETSEQPEPVLDPSDSENLIYTLTIEHVVNYQSDGVDQTRSVLEIVELVDSDFTDGQIDLSRFVQNQPGLQAVQIGRISISDFDENRQAQTRIVYRPASGWAVKKRQSAANGVEAGGIFEGDFSDVLFVPITQVSINVNFEYSKTGGMAGHSVSDSVQVDVQPVKNEQTGLYEIILPVTVPEADGFRKILDPLPLNKYVKNPPTGNETLEQIENALQNGDYNVVVDNPALPVYYGQADEQGNYAFNPIYQNKYSDQYNESWNEARTLHTDSFQAELLGSNGANVLENTQIKVTFTDEQLAAATEGPLQLTIFYRRNATWYGVHHWVAKSQSGLSDFTGMETRTVDGTEYVLMAQDQLQGRAGALTAAKPRTDGLFALLGALPMVQTRIASAQVDPSTGKVTTSTVVDIYYRGEAEYRVIFDTDHTYIPRQNAVLGDRIDLSALPQPTRLGYTFGGWQYTAEDGTKKDLGDSFVIDREFLDEANVETQDGVHVIRLTVKWIPDMTEVQVILWTEDLTGEDDVQALPDGGNPNYDRFAEFKAAPVTHHHGEEGASYSNLANFTYRVRTGTDLTEGDALIADLNNEVSTQFAQAIGTENTVDLAPLFSQDAFAITQAGYEDAQSTTASADGKTIVNVYFTRNIYTLKFHYYGTATKSGQTTDYSITTLVNGFSRNPVTDFINENEEFSFSYGASNAYYNNYEKVFNVNGPEDMPVPKILTVNAKYGADLRRVWPVARSGEAVSAAGNWNGTGTTTRLVSWCPTRGQYNLDFRAGRVSNPCIPALYGSMSPDMIANPSNPRIVNHLVAYWNSAAISTFENTMCYELPNITASNLNLDASGRAQREGVETVVLHNAAGVNNRIYLISQDDPIFDAYRFNDLLPCQLVDGQIQYGSGDQYAVRVYSQNNKCYAVGLRSQQISTNTVGAQAPSKIQNFQSVNTIGDHTSQFTNSARPGTGADNPYSLYFYYDRSVFEISYRAARDNDRVLELGTATIPVGAEFSSNRFGYTLDQNDQTGDAKFSWTTDQNVSVCPNKTGNGTKEWIFKGWSLSPSEDDLLWRVGDPEQITTLTGDLVLYAIWQVPSYTVSFDLAGGVDNGDYGPITCEIPENTMYSAQGIVPRPVRNGYRFEGWFDEQTKEAFDFDQLILSDKKVTARWTPITEENFTLKVRSLSRELKKGENPDDYETVILPDESGQDVTYYLLSQTVQGPSPLVDNAEYHLNPPVIEDYIPQSASQTVVLESGTDEYTVDFFYRPKTSREITIRFVEAGTENTNNPNVVREKKVSSSYFYTCFLYLPVSRRCTGHWPAGICICKQTSRWLSAGRSEKNGRTDLAGSTGKPTAAHRPSGS